MRLSRDASIGATSAHLELTLDATTHKLTVVPLVTAVYRRVTNSEP